jgi:hypothetical protein
MDGRLYSAVVEATPEYFAQAQRLVWSLLNEAQVPVDQIVLHSIAPVEDMHYFTSMGVRVVKVKPFLGNPWCNKLRQLDSLLTQDFFDAVLLDTDVLVLEEPPKAKAGTAHAKPVDFSSPPLEVLVKIYKVAGLLWTDAQADIDNSPTARANINGGVHVMHKDAMREIAGRWLHWAHWLMMRKSWLDGRTYLIDQISFAMAIAETGVPFEELDRRYNIPVNKYQHTQDLDRKPAIIHYHANVNEDGTLKTIGGLTTVNSEILRLNSRLKGHTFDREFLSK